MPVELDHRTIQYLFVGAWVALLFGGLVYAKALSPATKEKMRASLSIFVGLLFLIFVYLLYGPATSSFAALPVTLIVFLNSRPVKYCPKCVALNQSPFVFPSPKACPKCGNALVSASLSNG